jgi:hypothetical protein
LLPGRLGGDDIARMTLFLAADDSRMITAQSLIIDAGLGLMQNASETFQMLPLALQGCFAPRCRCAGRLRASVARVKY